MKIQVLGSGCAKCKSLYQNVQAAVKELDLPIETEYSTDITELISLGALGSPVVVIDGKIRSAGRVPAANEIATMIRETQSGGTTKEVTGSKGGCSCGGSC